jgi:hypothetical protein
VREEDRPHERSLQNRSAEYACAVKSQDLETAQQPVLIESSIRIDPFASSRRLDPQLISEEGKHHHQPQSQQTPGLLPKAAKQPSRESTKTSRPNRQGKQALSLQLFAYLASNLAFPAARLAANAPLIPNCVAWPSIRCVAFKFFWTMIWKHVALPWREAMTDHARKSSQIC